MYFYWYRSIVCLMRTIMVVVMKIIANPLIECGNSLVVIEINALIRYAMP